MGNVESEVLLNRVFLLIVLMELVDGVPLRTLLFLSMLMNLFKAILTWRY